MSNQRNREEVVNTQLALVISKLGTTADAETIHLHGKHRPDVLFQMRGLRIAIEGKFADTHNAEGVALSDARKRISSGIAHIAAAAIYPPNLRNARTTELIDKLTTTKLRYAILTESSEKTEWYEGRPSEIMDAFRRAQETLAQDNIVEETAKSLSIQLETVSTLWSGQPGACDRLSILLGTAPPSDEDTGKAAERRESVAKISALVLANAFIFQEQLALSDPRIETLRTLSNENDVVQAAASHWRWIWENINYVPIFQLAERVLEQLPESRNTTIAVGALLSEAQAICRRQAALRHDLMGRIYHWLLHDAKYLGTYYTSTSAATLLLKLAIHLDNTQDFSTPRKLADYKVADLACGTGTLLMAAAQAITDRYIGDRADQDLPLSEKDLSILHQTLMQNIIHGYDILPTAVHLTASTLGLLAPDVAFRTMNLFVMPIGVDHGLPRLGSLSFLDGPEIKTQFSLDNSHLDSLRTGTSKSMYANAKIPALDLCVMNPPFVSSRYGNRLFGSLPDERVRLQKALSKQAKKLDVKATAGLGALFVPLAEKSVKRGGRIAFVLPVAVATGEAWGAIRTRIARSFHLEVVITSHDPDSPNFSENTNLSELLFIARRLKNKEKPGLTSYINLWRNVRSIHEALDVAARIQVCLGRDEIRPGMSERIKSSTGTIGEIVHLPHVTGTSNWTGAIFAQGRLLRSFWLLDEKDELKVPGESGSYKVPMCRLGELGALGYDVRDIFDAFEVERNVTEKSLYSGFWDHDANKVVTISQQPNASLEPLTVALKGRPLKSADAVWSKAGRILLVSRLRTNTHRVIAVGHPRKVLGNTWWSLDDSGMSVNQRRALLLWLNSTLGILSYFGRRAITEGAWMQMKKPAWSSMRVLDVRALSTTQLDAFSRSYADLSERELNPIAQLDEDQTRQKLDATICRILKLPDLSPLRELLAREPGLSAKPVRRSPTSSSRGGE